MKRIRYFDLLRCISFCFIIFYHMISQLYFSKLFPLDKILPFYENDNMNIAMLGVAVFFILSGAGLAYSTAENFDIRRFYKRFIRVLIPFYITYISYFIYKSDNDRFFLHPSTTETSAWKIILHSSAWMNGSVSTEFIRFPCIGPVVPRCSAAVIFTFLCSVSWDEKNSVSFCRFHLYLSAFAVLLSIQYSGACESADQGI